MGDRWSGSGGYIGREKRNQTPEADMAGKVQPHSKQGPTQRQSSNYNYKSSPGNVDNRGDSNYGYDYPQKQVKRNEWNSPHSTYLYPPPSNPLPHMPPMSPYMHPTPHIPHMGYPMMNNMPGTSYNNIPQPQHSYPIPAVPINYPTSTVPSSNPVNIAMYPHSAASTGPNELYDPLALPPSLAPSKAPATSSSVSSTKKTASIQSTLTNNISQDGTTGKGTILSSHGSKTLSQASKPSHMSSTSTTTSIKTDKLTTTSMSTYKVPEKAAGPVVMKFEKPARPSISSTLVASSSLLSRPKSISSTLNTSPSKATVLLKPIEIMGKSNGSSISLSPHISFKPVVTPIKSSLTTPVSLVSSSIPKEEPEEYISQSTSDGSSKLKSDVSTRNSSKENQTDKPSQSVVQPSVDNNIAKKETSSVFDTHISSTTRIERTKEELTEKFDQRDKISSNNVSSSSTTIASSCLVPFSSKPQETSSSTVPASTVPASTVSSSQETSSRLSRWSPERRNGPIRRPYSPDRRPYSPERRPYSPGRRPYSPERRPYSPERRQYSPDRRYRFDRRPYSPPRRRYSPDGKWRPQSPDIEKSVVVEQSSSPASLQPSATPTQPPVSTPTPQVHVSVPPKVSDPEEKAKVLEEKKLLVQPPPPATQSPQPPPKPRQPRKTRTLDHYTIISEISEGAYGVVYKATDLETKELVALKKVKVDPAKEKEAGFPISSIREIRTLVSLKHENIVNLRDVVTDEHGVFYLVLDYIEHDLHQLLKPHRGSTNPFSLAHTKSLVLQLLKSIEFLHSKNIMHRDIKSSNLLVSSKGHLYLADFGLTKEFVPTGSRTPTVVTLGYRAPELAFQAPDYNLAVDIWSVGCIMAELLLGIQLIRVRSELELVGRLCEVFGTPNRSNYGPGYDALQIANMESTIGLKIQPQNKLQEHFPSLSRQGFDLLSKLLCYNPDTRIKASAAVSHPWFKEYPPPAPPTLSPEGKVIESAKSIGRPSSTPARNNLQVSTNPTVNESLTQQ